jgi:antitoxin component YwqK of YwqJK toxin-antitoxin module
MTEIIRQKKIVVCNYKNGMRHGEFKYYDDEILVKYDWYKDDEEFKNILHIC